MNGLIEPRVRVWAVAAIVAGIALMLGLELYEEPDLTPLELLFELVDITPIVMTSSS